MDTLLYFQSTATTSAIGKLTGISRAARDCGWIVQRFDLHDYAQVQREIAFWHPVGCIIETSSDDMPLSKATLNRVPTVLLDCQPSLTPRSVATVSQDPTAIGSAAAEFLFDLKLASYAYIGWHEQRFWDRIRRNSYAKALRRHGVKAHVYTPNATNAAIGELRRQIAEWLKTLPTPAGIYAVNDSMAVQIIEAARLVDLSVPGDLVILGTDNEEELCESISPTLSSIALDFESAGEDSVRILKAMIDGVSARRHLHFGVLKIIQRASTRRSSRTDNETRDALDFIRTRCSYGITSKDVLALFKCSRRTAESRFHALTGHSILEEIHIQRVEQAKKLIRNPATKLSMVATMCGFRSNPFFARVFRRITGLTMQEWRNKNC